jgi:hypothetical protein
MIISGQSGLAPNPNPTILDITESPIKCLRRGDDFSKLNKIDIEIAMGKV